MGGITGSANIGGKFVLALIFRNHPKPLPPASRQDELAWSAKPILSIKLQRPTQSGVEDWNEVLII
jgi:hypothetical protein